MDVNTRELKASDDTDVVRGLVIDQVRQNAYFYVGCTYYKNRMIVDYHGRLRCELRHACLNCNTYFLVTMFRRVDDKLGYVVHVT